MKAIAIFNPEIMVLQEKLSLLKKLENQILKLI